MKKLIGKVTPTERDEIRSMFERKNGLTELFKIIDPSNEALYNKVIVDMGATSSRFQKWWNDKSMQYNWESREDGTWEIDFESCEIFLVK